MRIWSVFVSYFRFMTFMMKMKGMHIKACCCCLLLYIIFSFLCYFILYILLFARICKKEGHGGGFCLHFLISIFLAWLCVMWLWFASSHHDLNPCTLRFYFFRFNYYERVLIEYSRKSMNFGWRGLYSYKFVEPQLKTLRGLGTRLILENKEEFKKIYGNILGILNT